MIVFFRKSNLPNLYEVNAMNAIAANLTTSPNKPHPNSLPAPEALETIEASSSTRSQNSRDSNIYKSERAKSR